VVFVARLSGREKWCLTLLYRLRSAYLQSMQATGFIEFTLGVITWDGRRYFL
jgi:hypothetical protein